MKINNSQIFHNISKKESFSFTKKSKNLYEKIETKIEKKIQREMKKKYLKNKFIVPIKLIGNKDYKELKNNPNFKDINFKKMLIDINSDRDFKVAEGLTTIGENYNNRIKVFPPVKKPDVEPMKFDPKTFNLKEFIKVLKEFVNDNRISTKDKKQALNRIYDVESLYYVTNEVRNSL